MLHGVSEWQHDECRCVGRFSPNTAVSLGTQVSSVISGVTRQKFTKFLHNVATSPPLLMCTFRQWYLNSFLNDSAKNASGISRRSWHFPKINWLLWQRPLRNRKTRYRCIICTQRAFIRWKDRKNRSSISWDIRLNTPVFCHVIQKVHKWAPFSLELLDQSTRKFYTIYRHHLCC